MTQAKKPCLSVADKFGGAISPGLNEISTYLGIKYQSDTDSD